MVFHNIYKCIEFIILYIVLPLLFFLNIIPSKFLIPTLIFLLFYTLFILKINFIPMRLNFTKTEFISVLIRFIFMGILFIILSYMYFPKTFLQLFNNEFKIFLVLIILYPFLSVLPQEMLYREFFFKRYGFNLNPKIRLLFNAFIFMWAHIVFGNGTVLVLTFIAGLLFAYTYLKSRSLLLVCIEHTLYGYLLFVSGLAELFFQSGTLSMLRTLFS